MAVFDITKKIEQAAGDFSSRNFVSPFIFDFSKHPMGSGDVTAFFKPVPTFQFKENTSMRVIRGEGSGVNVEWGVGFFATPTNPLLSLGTVEASTTGTTSGFPDTFLRGLIDPDNVGDNFAIFAGLFIGLSVDASASNAVVQMDWEYLYWPRPTLQVDSLL